jgi:5-methyltetrahydropteroyltriglutamate--homocysteine methyltransferase
MQTIAAPFRADMVGSLLRSATLKDARASRETGKFSADQLRAVEDIEIVKLIRKQEQIGLEAVTDGEYRRAYWHFDFLQNLDGCEGFWMDEATVAKSRQTAFKGAALRPWMVRVIGKLGFSTSHPHIQHFKFLKCNTKHVAKMTIPSPSMLHYRGGRSVISADIYPTLDAFYADLGATYAKAVRGFYDAGCRYLQIDDVSLAYLCDPAQREMLANRGEDPERQLAIYRDVLNTALAAKPKDMIVTAHLCRGNFRSTFVASGGYEPVANLLFNELKFDGYFLEWDNERSGGFEPLRHLPHGHKRVVLGLVTTKLGTLETKDALKRRIDEAAKYAPLDQLCLSPQCGFASTEEGNTLAEADQWAKLKLVVEVAKEVWG